MENKKTSELLDLIWELDNTPEDKQKDGHWEKYEEANAELRKREPFKRLLGESEYSNEYLTHEEQLAEFKDDIKLLKRHKHDEKNGDVLVRI